MLESEIANLRVKRVDGALSDDEFRRKAYDAIDVYITNFSLAQGDIYVAKKAGVWDSFVVGTPDYCDSPKLWHITEGTWANMEYWTKRGYSDFTKFTKHES